MFDPALLRSFLTFALFHGHFLSVFDLNPIIIHRKLLLFRICICRKALDIKFCNSSKTFVTKVLTIWILNSYRKSLSLNASFCVKASRYMFHQENHYHYDIWCCVKNKSSHHSIVTLNNSRFGQFSLFSVNNLIPSLLCFDFLPLQIWCLHYYSFYWIIALLIRHCTSTISRIFVHLFFQIKSQDVKDKDSVLWWVLLAERITSLDRAESYQRNQASKMHKIKLLSSSLKNLKQMSGI